MGRSAISQMRGERREGRRVPIAEPSGRGNHRRRLIQHPENRFRLALGQRVMSHNAELFPQLSKDRLPAPGPAVECSKRHHSGWISRMARNVYCCNLTGFYLFGLFFVDTLKVLTLTHNLFNILFSSLVFIYMSSVFTNEDYWQSASDFDVLLAAPSRVGASQTVLYQRVRVSISAEPS